VKEKSYLKLALSFMRCKWKGVPTAEKAALLRVLGHRLRCVVQEHIPIQWESENVAA
jgi:hypothetical protein